jgi:septal ring factor EnvC (AmiA/AmiB activator)
MWFWIWLVTFVSGGGLIQVLDSERRRLADRLREWTDTATSQQELIRRRDAQNESLEMTIKELQVQIGNRDQSFKKLQEKLSEVYTELHNLRRTESMLAEQTAGHGLYSSASIPSGDGQTGR